MKIKERKIQSFIKQNKNLGAKDFCSLEISLGNSYYMNWFNTISYVNKN